MADIELVIKIPEKTVNDIKDNAMFAGSISSEILWDVNSAIVNGTPLPKGHGRLIDADATLKRHCTELCAKRPSCYEDCLIYDLFHLASTIIEADKTENEPQERSDEE